MSSFLDAITIDDFKTKFARDFKYLPVWEVATNYFIGDKVYYDINHKFYIAKTNNTGIMPTTVTDWGIAPDNILLYISDAELTQALREAKIKFNISLKYPSEDFTKDVFLTLMAHTLYNKVNGSGMQADAGTYETSRRVGSVSQSFSIPNFMLNNPFWFYYKSSKYGIDYAVLMQPIFAISSISRIDTKTRL